jgi:hypothetical protein
MALTFSVGENFCECDSIVALVTILRLLFSYMSTSYFIPHTLLKMRLKVPNL